MYTMQIRFMNFTKQKKISTTINNKIQQALELGLPEPDPDCLRFECSLHYIFYGHQKKKKTPTTRITHKNNNILCIENVYGSTSQGERLG